ncbi:MAG: SpoIIE family protein phosphatase [Candidatus Omnitrophica bacterium]|nr:SpoIIE family protein phosphatase [Candidatus Omnitrophota bacterium]
MIKTKSITFKLAFSILTSTSIIFLLIFGYNYAVTRKLIERNIRSSAENLVQSTVNRIDAVLRPIERVPQNIVHILESAPYNKDTVISLLASAVRNNPDIYGSTAAFEPYALDKDLAEFAPYFYKHAGAVKYKFLKGSYNYLSWDWYQIPKELGRAVWSDPFFDEGGGNIIMATYSVPLHAVVNGKPKVIGIVTADISLSWLQEIVSSIHIGKTGYGFLIGKNGRIITHPLKELVMNETIFDLAEARGDPRLRAIGKEMIEGRSGFTLSKSIVTGKKCWLAYAPLPASGWSLGVIFPQDELMADIHKLNAMVFFLGIAGFLFLLMVIILISRSITSPILMLHQTTKDIAKGNLDFELPPRRSSDEVGALAEAFLYMRTALKKYIQELTETTASKERMESELRIAHNIQLSLVPKIFPPYPDRPEFDIYAVLDPAKEVGGDFYDFFFVDATHFCIVIGDVVGKGVPAALLMAVTKTLVKTYAVESKSPELVLSKVNKELSEGNTSCMFVSIFIGIFDIKTADLVYSNAGHNPPIIMGKDRKPVFFDIAGATAAGIDETISYKNERLSLSKGDIICMFTDGVTEAFNREKEAFSEERLMSSLAASSGKPLKNIVGDVLGNILSFTGTAPQSDDITLLLFKINAV